SVSQNIAPEPTFGITKRWLWCDVLAHAKTRTPGLEGFQSCFRDLDILAPVSTTHAETTNDTLFGLDGETTPEDNQAVGLDDTVQEWGVVLHEIEPFMCCHTKSNGGVCFVLRNLHAQ